MAQTTNTDLQNVGKSGKNTTRQAVPQANGNWITFLLEGDRKYEIKHTGNDTSGNQITTRIKLQFGTTEPDAGGGAGTFSAETETEWLQAGDTFYPRRGTSAVSMKAETGTQPFVRLAVIERNVQGTQG